MSVTPLEGIQPLWSVFPGEHTEKTSPELQPGMFAEIYQSAIDNVKTTDGEKNRLEYLLATGQLDNPAELTIASTQAGAAVDLLIQLRNKALDAYSELMRINL